MEAPFFILAAITVLGALGAAFFRNIMHCALSLILFFFGIAGEFFLLRAEFVGAVQLLVYAGAVGILLLFAVMLTRHFGPGQSFNPISGGRLGWVIGFLTALFVGIVLVWAISGDPSFTKPVMASPTVKVAQIGTQMMQDYVIPFEVIGLLLTAAMIGAIVIAWEEVKPRS